MFWIYYYLCQNNDWNKDLIDNIHIYIISLKNEIKLKVKSF